MFQDIIEVADLSDYLKREHLRIVRSFWQQGDPRPTIVVEPISIEMTIKLEDKQHAETANPNS